MRYLSNTVGSFKNNQTAPPTFPDDPPSYTLLRLILAPLPTYSARRFTSFYTANIGRELEDSERINSWSQSTETPYPSTICRRYLGKIFLTVLLSSHTSFFSAYSSGREGSAERTRRLSLLLDEIGELAAETMDIMSSSLHDRASLGVGVRK